MRRVMMLWAGLLAGGAAAQPQGGQSQAGQSQVGQSQQGQTGWIQCRACHSLEAGAPHKLGPNLTGIIGQPAASRAGFNYSPALKASGLVWDRATLDRWIEKPSAVLKGHRMVFIGMPDAARRAALIDFIANRSPKGGK